MVAYAAQPVVEEPLWAEPGLRRAGDKPGAPAAPRRDGLPGSRNHCIGDVMLTGAGELIDPPGRCGSPDHLQPRIRRVFLAGNCAPQSGKILDRTSARRFVR